MTCGNSGLANPMPGVPTPDPDDRERTELAGVRLASQDELWGLRGSSGVAVGVSGAERGVICGDLSFFCG